jgi:predicted NUDIX family phosphoesterase
MSKIAHIIAIRTASLGDLGFGISHQPGDVDHIFEEGEVWIGPRPKLEVDFDFVQPIPYIVIRDGENVLVYQRGEGGGDARLHANSSIGFGGHVDGSDAVYDDDGVIDLRATMQTACIRELEEELGISLLRLSDEQRAGLCNWAAVISSAASDVDKVHVGLVAVIDVQALPGIDPAKFEDVIENARWAAPQALVLGAAAGDITLETWTDLVLRHPF